MNPCQPNALTNSQVVTDFPSPLPLRRLVNAAGLRGEGKGEGLILRSWFHFMRNRERRLSMNRSRMEPAPLTPTLTPSEGERESS